MNHSPFHLLRNTGLALGVVALAAAMPAQSRKSPDLVDTAVAAGSFQTLVTAVKAAGLVDVLKGEGPFTVFAPSDEAFAKLPDGAIAALLEQENRAQLTAILTYHVVPGRLKAADVLGRFQLDTVNGQRLDVDAEQLTIDDAKIVKTDIETSNGVIHVIDSVLLPTTKDLIETAREAGNFRTLYAAGKAAGIVDAIRGEGPFTVLAPNDEAFAKVPAETLKGLLRPENKATLKRILEYHVIPGRVYANQAVAAVQGATLAEAPVSFRIDGGRLRANDATVLATDIEASNGVIHVIDAVLMPPAAPAKQSAQPRGRKLFGFRNETPDTDLARHLGVNAHQVQFVTSVTPDSEAAKGGLKAYDVIVTVAGKPAGDEAFDAAKEAADYGEEVEFVVLRAGQKKHLKIRVGEER